MSSPDQCDECGHDLLPVGDELYCPECDVGPTALTDFDGKMDTCKDCGTNLSAWYPYQECPTCFTTEGEFQPE